MPKGRRDTGRLAWTGGTSVIASDACVAWSCFPVCYRRGTVASAGSARRFQRDLVQVLINNVEALRVARRTSDVRGRPSSRSCGHGIHPYAVGHCPSARTEGKASGVLDCDDCGVVGRRSCVRRDRSIWSPVGHVAWPGPEVHELELAGYRLDGRVLRPPCAQQVTTLSANATVASCRSLSCQLPSSRQ